MNEQTFTPFPKIARLSRECIITEKLDGTNAQIRITDDGQMLIGSRSRWITPGDDNYGFAKWATKHKDELMQLGPGSHFGEWWGGGIQRGYGLESTDKRFSLFNVTRWRLLGTPILIQPDQDPRKQKPQETLPTCCGLVPVLYRGIFSCISVEIALAELKTNGSAAVPGFMRPEGVVVYHVAANTMFKKTIEKDEAPKSQII